jgi:hypothetical protein
LTLTSYTVGHGLPEAFVEALAVGMRLPDMPLFLHADWYVNVPLERTYDPTWEGMSNYWRELVGAEH